MAKSKVKTDIYEYRDYKQLLRHWLDDETTGGRGSRKLLAEAMGCQVSHVTNVLNGDSHLSLEQADAAARHFGFSQGELDYFLLLLQLNRAGTRGLRESLSRLLEEHSARHRNLKERLKISETVRREQESLYYSSWHYGAIHVLLSIPEFQTRESLSQRLSLPQERVDEVLAFLVDAGLAEKQGVAQFQIRNPVVHLAKSSPLIRRHHANWRLKTIAALESGAVRFSSADSFENLHYSAVVTLSDDDLARVREILTRALAESLDVIRASPEQDAAVLSIDWHRL